MTTYKGIKGVQKRKGKGEGDMIPELAEFYLYKRFGADYEAWDMRRLSLFSLAEDIIVEYEKTQRGK